MNHNVSENEIRLNTQTEAFIAYHKIIWSDIAEPSRICSGGNIYHHTVPVTGTTIHSHDFIEILFVLSGTLKHAANGDSVALKPGHIVFIRPVDMHCIKPLRSSMCELLNLSFSLRLFLTLSEYLENDIFLKQFTGPVNPPLFRMDDPKFTKLCNRVLSLNSISATPQYKKIKIKILLAELFTHFFLDETNFLRENQVPAWIDTLCEAMRRPKNFIEGLPKMNKLAPCTKEHLCKSFKRFLKKTPTEFINELRMSYAARKLSDTDTDICSIAFELNIQSLSRFYFLFKKYYGVSPANYRKNARAGKNIL